MDSFPVLTFEALTAAITEIAVEDCPLDPSSLLIEDVGLDSLEMAELILVLEEIAGTLISDVGWLSDSDHTLAELVDHVNGVILDAAMDVIAEPQSTVGPRLELIHSTPLDGPRVALRPMLSDADWGFVYELVALGAESTNFRLQGALPRPEQFRAVFGLDCLLETVAFSRAGEPLGYLCAYGYDDASLTASVAVIFKREARNTVHVIEAFMLFVHRLIFGLGLRKVLIEASEQTLPQFASLASAPFEVEAVLKNHRLVGSSYSDITVLALHRDVWFRYVASKAWLSGLAAERS